MGNDNVVSLAAPGALGATIAGRGLAVWDAEVLHQLAARGLRAAAPHDRDIEAFEGADWQVVAALLGAEPPHLGGEADEALHRSLLACLREAIGKLVADQDHDGLAALYRNLFDRELSITATLARELLLIDTVGDVPSSPPLATAEPCLHVPEWNSLWTDGRVPTAFLCRQTLILGETGSGKTISGVKPLLNALLAPDLPDGTGWCVLVVDPKRELWDAVAGPRCTTHRCRRLTPQSPANALAGRPSVLATNQHALSAGVHSATSLAPLLCRLTRGLARVRFSRSDANTAFTDGGAAHSPLSWASEVATMCSMSVSPVPRKHPPV